ncbi:MAG: hypothetical protein QGI08_04270 [Paracoccaceae bacterium]|nr:hypothetical protein [Paracoccaceae bacterium]
MTVEQQVDALTASVDKLKGAVVSKKATLDASVADAQSATAQAQAAKANALSARDQAGAFKDTAYSAAQSAASAVAYQDLSAVALTKAVKAVDVFIYDTSKDSDGGAWRHRCAGTSWYREPLNTATRGARREFPAVVALVLEKGKLTIYDGDDPDLPMWMVINGYSIGAYLFVDGYGCEATSIAARNGALVATGKPIGDPSEGNNFGGALIFNFVSDTTQKIGTYGYNSNYGSKNGVRVVNFGPLGTFQRSPVVRLPNGWINDVAMTVLPDAQENPSTGLPELTLAFATKGGVALLRQDGSVTSSAETLEAGDVVFNPENELISGYYAAHLRIYGPVNQLSSPTFTQKGIVAGVAGGTINVPFYMSSFTDGRAFGGAGIRGGLTKLMLNSASIGSLCAAAISASYTTGWMPGAIKGAWLADTDDSVLVGEDLAINGSFDADASGWFLGTDWQYDAANRRVARVGSTYHNLIPAATIANLITGETYTIEVECGSGAGTVGYYTASATNGALATGVNHITFTYTGGQYPFFYSSSNDRWIDNFKIFRSIPDRSVAADGKKASGFIVKGTIGRAPVAVGAELVGYSGFSSTNYLEQPYNSALDFGTGDFCMMGWYRGGALNSTGTFFSRQSAPHTGFHFFKDTATDPSDERLAFRANGATYYSSIKGEISKWLHVVALRRNGVLEIYQDAVLGFIGPMAGDISDLRPTAFIGYNPIAPTITVVLGMALWRVGGTAPTADQIRRIYEDEKVLFQENAACTLYGVSDAVAALAHDPDTGLLHVGTSAGRSVFKGLRRVANTTAPVATAIAAAGDLVVEQ